MRGHKNDEFRNRLRNFFWGRKNYANVFDPVMLRLVNNTATVNKATNLICIYLQGTVPYNRINYRLLTG